MRTVLVVLTVVIGITAAACWPVIGNLSKGRTVPEAIERYVPKESRILVLPLWSDGDISNFRDPYIIPASAIGTPEAEVPRRMGFYIDMYACGGPWKYVTGYLVVLESGSVIWSDFRGETTSNDVGTFKSELKLMLENGEVGPRLRELMQYRTGKLGMHASDKERAAALSFVQAIPDAENPRHEI